MAQILMNPLLMADESHYTNQELREVRRNKKNISLLSSHVATLFIDHLEKSGGFKEGLHIAKVMVFIECVLAQFPETDVLIQKIVIPYTVRVYGETSGENVGKTINDIQFIIDNYGNFITTKQFVSMNDEMQVSVALSFGFERDELRYLGDREVLLPLINSKGRPRTDLDTGGYLTVDLPAILKSKDHHDMPINLEALNVLQQLELFISWDYIRAVADDSTNQYERTATRKSLDAVMEEFELTGVNPTLRFVWQYDSRGRIYPHAWGLNPNGRAYLKGMFRVKPQMLTEEGRLEVLRYVGTMAGYDKFTYDVREAKALELIKAINLEFPELLEFDSLTRMKAYNEVVFGSLKDSFTNIIDVDESEPYLLIGALEAYFDDQLGLPVGLLMRQDATSSGKLLPFSH